ncbi:MAG TPA: phosphotransferase [Pyrinomonadaceae bacterium]|nr:phosphotransferase [Pyrinomonadaceae bacterium]
MLTQRAVVPYLLQRRLITEESIVEGDLAVVDASRRNLNFQVISERGPCYLLKQGVGPDGIETVRHEATVYQLLQPSAIANLGLDRHLPCFFEYDPKERVLIIEFLRDAQNLTEYHDRRGRFPTTIAAAIGTALATLHRLNWTGGQREGDAGRLKLPPAWVLSSHRPNLGMLQHLSSATIQAIKIIQQFPEFCELLDSLRQEWTNETPIHFDLKWDNYLIMARRSGHEKSNLRIVDWELAGIGDPCWDVGSVFNDYLSYWLSSIPITGGTPPERFLELARYPLAKMHPAIRSFWESYVRHMKLGDAISAEWLLRAVKYAAARLVQTVYEGLYHSIKLTGNAVCSLQVSLNILRRPQEASLHLLGIPLPSGTTR